MGEVMETPPAAAAASLAEGPGGSLHQLMQRDDLRPTTRAWLAAQYGVTTREPGMWTQTLTFVDDGVDAVVKGGDRRLYVHDPSSGQKMELGYSDNTTVGELRERVQVLLRYRGRVVMGSGCGMSCEAGDHWTRGPLICGGVLLADDARAVSSYVSADGESTVVFPVGTVGEVLSAAADPDLSLQAVRQALETNISLPRLLRHTNRGPGGISGNFESSRPEAPELEWEA